MLRRKFYARNIFTIELIETKYFQRMVIYSVLPVAQVVSGDIATATT